MACTDYDYGWDVVVLQVALHVSGSKAVEDIGTAACEKAQLVVEVQGLRAEWGAALKQLEEVQCKVGGWAAVKDTCRVCGQCCSVRCSSKCVRDWVYGLQRLIGG